MSCSISSHSQLNLGPMFGWQGKARHKSDYWIQTILVWILRCSCLTKGHSNRVCREGQMISGLHCRQTRCLWERDPGRVLSQQHHEDTDTTLNTFGMIHQKCRTLTQKGTGKQTSYLQLAGGGGGGVALSHVQTMNLGRPSNALGEVQNTG